MSSSKARVTIFPYRAASLFRVALGRQVSSSPRAPAMRNKQPNVEQKRCQSSGDCRSPPGTQEGDGDIVFLQPTS